MRVGILVDITEGFEEPIRHARSLGFDFGQLVNWNMELYTDENSSRLKALLSEVGFTVTDLWCGWSAPVIWKHPEKYSTLGLVPKQYRKQRLEDLKRGAEFAHKLGVKNIITHTGYIPDDPEAEARIGVIEALKELCTELQSRGQSFAFETGEELPLTLSMVINEIGMPNTGINFDPANLISGGRVDFKGLFEQLKRLGYKGDIVIEHEMKGREDRDADIIAAKEYLEEVISEVGI